MADMVREESCSDLIPGGRYFNSDIEFDFVSERMVIMKSTKDDQPQVCNYSLQEDTLTIEPPVGAQQAKVYTVAVDRGNLVLRCTNTGEHMVLHPSDANPTPDSEGLDLALVGQRLDPGSKHLQ
eukprot:Sspe_Gene.119168::Locus_114377_Transcript_1_1_Confidence_1.000_Length_694::g.119168::m.119168